MFLTFFGLQILQFNELYVRSTNYNQLIVGLMPKFLYYTLILQS